MFFLNTFANKNTMDTILKYFPELTPKQREQFAALQGVYEFWNSQINVISRKDIDELYVRHVLHSLAIARTGLIVKGMSVLDVGCGGGFPGIPLAILYPDVSFTMCDSIGKKIKVVTEVATALGLTNVIPVNARAEELPERYDFVVSRAVTELSKFVGWTWSKTFYGILYLKGGDLAQEIADAAKPTKIYDISRWFDEDFFETKKVLYLKK